MIKTILFWSIFFKKSQQVLYPGFEWVLPQVMGRLEFLIRSVWANSFLYFLKLEPI
jgi:hypothetical protein